MHNRYFSYTWVRFPPNAPHLYIWLCLFHHSTSFYLLSINIFLYFFVCLFFFFEIPPHFLIISHFYEGILNQPDYHFYSPFSIYGFRWIRGSYFFWSFQCIWILIQYKRTKIKVPLSVFGCPLPPSKKNPQLHRWSFGVYVKNMIKESSQAAN